MGDEVAPATATAGNDCRFCCGLDLGLTAAAAVVVVGAVGAVTAVGTGDTMAAKSAREGMTWVVSSPHTCHME